MSAAANASKFTRYLNSETGPKTVHFWAPVMKWALVIAGISDFARPVETLSGTQNAALFATGFIWTRWCLIIKPKNYLLASVNFFLGCTASVQLGRIIMYQKSLGLSTSQAVQHTVFGATFQEMWAKREAEKEVKA